MNFARTIASLALAASASMIQNAMADYPEKPVKLIVPYAPGGSVDAFARVISPGLEAGLKQTIVVENIQGAGGSIGIARTTKAAADGYTIALGITSDVLLAPLTESTAQYSYRDLEAVAPLGTSGAAVVARPSLGIKNFGELIAYAKANPGKLSYGATGAGSLPALAMESLKNRAKIQITFVPYQSASKIALDVMGGHLDLAVSGLPALIEPIKSGKLTGLGVMSKDRDIGAPDMPAAGETPELKGMDFYFWTGLFAPKGTPAPIVARLNTVFTDVLRDEKVRTRFREFGVKISEPTSPADFAKFVVRSNADWEAVLKQTNLQKK
jgi:tripartite-type tricarboxylate transporter receptor subunit TctC